jgi:hypothetical protein
MAFTQGTTANADSRSEGAFIWERQPSESIQAFSRFLAYRDLEPGERSHRKVASICAISETLVNRWGKRWQWTKRAIAYDMWVLELGDQLGKRAHLSARGAAVRFGSLALDKASRTVAKLDESKLSADEAIALAVNGAKLGRQALGLTEGETRAERAPVAQVAVSFGSGSFGPAWSTQAKLTQGETNESKQNETVVLSGEKVLGETPATLVRARLAERVVNCPKGNSK